MPDSNSNAVKTGGALVWFRRDLRAFDHAALHHALQAGGPVWCAFVFDQPILAGLPRDDRRVAFIHASLQALAGELEALGGHLLVRHGDAADIIPALAAELGVAGVFANEDYEPAAIARDTAVATVLDNAGRAMHLSKDQVIFAKSEVLSQAGKPLGVFTPYKNAWLRRLDAEPEALAPWHVEPHAAAFAPGTSALLSLKDIGFDGADLAAAGITPGMAGGAALFVACGLWQRFNRAEPLVWSAIITASEAGLRGGLGALGLVREARTQLEQAERINPRALNGSIYVSLGSLYAQVPGAPIGFGNRRRAREYLQRGLAMAPNDIDANFFMGDLLVRERDWTGAARYLQKAIDAPARPGRAAADRGRKAEARALLARAQQQR